MGKIVAWIVNFESSDHVAASLSSGLGNEVDEIVVLDNGSSVRDYEALVRITRDSPKTTLLRSDVNGGFGAGHNAISAQTLGDPDDRVWLLNPDVIVPAGVATKLAADLESGIADIVSPVVKSVRGDVERLWFSGGVVDRRRGRVVQSQLGSDPSALASAQTHLSTQFITGAAPMMLRRTWSELGGFDERLFLYWEDVDLSLRAASLGLRMRVRTDAAIVHIEGGSSKGDARLRRTVYYYSSRNRILVCRGHDERGFGYVFGLGAPQFLALLAHGVLREGPGRLARVGAAVKGALDALRTSSRDWDQCRSSQWAV